MRQIKFRAKRMDSNEWLFGSLFVDKEEQCYIKEPDGKLYFIEDKETVGQFTGLKDNNGVDVYEGDILRVREIYNELWLLCHTQEEFNMFSMDDARGEVEKEYVTAVAFEDGCWCISSNNEYNDTFLSCLFGDMKKSQPIFEFEVIGNIYDNPELIK